MTDKIYASFTDRELLRLHIEAVWGIKLLDSLQNSEDVLVDGKQPPWLLYVGQLAHERVAIWRPNVNDAQRRLLQARIDKAFDLTLKDAQAQGVEQEIAFKFTAQPVMDLAQAQQVARLLTTQEQALIETFAEGAATYYLKPECEPLYGVHLEGRLLSIAHSARSTPEACELGIDTLPEARRRGYALAVTILWTTSVLRQGRIPFYSALSQNTASLALAYTAGYRAFVRGVSFLHP